MNVDSIPYISLFSGVAGLDLSIRIALPNARCIGMCDRERAGCEILDARIKEGSLDDAPIFTDVRTFPSELYRGRVAGVVAGFPCPDYSVAGKRAGIVGKHGQLWDYLATVIRDVGPDWVFLENVSGIYVPHGGDAGAVLPAGLWFVLGDLANLGFNAQWLRLRASDVGASHGRARWFCLAHKPGGRLRIGGEPSGSGGLADGSDAELGHAAGNDEWREPESAMHGEGLAAGGSSGRVRGAGPVADANGESGDVHGRQLAGVRVPSGASSIMADTPRDERPGPDGEAGTGRGVRGAGAGVADAGDGQFPESRREPRERNGAGPAEPVLADTEYPERRTERKIDADAHGRSGSGRLSSELGNPDQPGPQGRQQREYSADEGAAGAAGDSGLPLFAPGPSDPLWAYILAEFPWLAPAISEEEAESAVRGMASRLAGRVDIEDRTDKLRALGNMVCPLQAAVALTVLARRAALT